MTTTPDTLTKSWIRGPADELAARNGCRFAIDRGLWTAWWIERFCKLYEGDGFAGSPMILRGCHQCHEEPEVPLEWDERGDTLQLYLDRAERHNACFRAGHFLDWQFECMVRLFSWVRPSKQWKRDVRRFRQACIFVAKKCKKTPTVGAAGMYLLAGDGEPGQKVFLAAKNGDQVRTNLAKHIHEMLRQSDDLSEVCKPNLTTMSIEHSPSRSMMSILSSSNKRTQESKEGLNGSVLIDEIHVVDREFVSRISRAGISRSEPLQIEVSTAGNNPDGYGAERFAYAMEVDRGERVDQELFVAIYAAPQDLADADLETDPLKYGRLANPAMGHTVDPEEYLADYAKSKSSLYKLAEFKMYRLNIWQKSANPWLRMSDWDQCRAEFSETTLAGRECWAALDLARTRDLSALVLVFPGDAEDEFFLLPYFWIPEDRAAELEPLCAVREWQRAGALAVIPGGVTLFAYIEEEFRRLAKLFSIQGLLYDPHFSEDVTQRISEGSIDSEGTVLAEATGVERILFKQSDDNFAQCTDDFERLVIAHKIKHPGNPVLTWQAAHAAVIQRQNKVKRVVKPTKNDYRTVDGIVASIMGLAKAMVTERTQYSVEVWG